MHHILVVEDEQHLAIGIKYNLEAEGFDVSVAGDGPTALRLVESATPPIDLVILDLMLPGMSGYSVCEKLRADGRMLPILMLSARTLADDRIRGYEVGTDQYLQKPFDLDELLAMVRNLLKRRGALSTSSSTRLNDEVYCFGQARINFNTFEATVGQQPLELTAMEVKLLRHFVDREGSVVSRNELLEKVWGLSSSPTTRTVDNFIVRLRRYFEADPANPRHFLSVRGAGYRFVSNPTESAGPAESTTQAEPGDLPESNGSPESTDSPESPDMPESTE